MSVQLCFTLSLSLSLSLSLLLQLNISCTAVAKDVGPGLEICIDSGLSTVVLLSVSSRATSLRHHLCAAGCVLCIIPQRQDATDSCLLP
jgi:hypothetical protein